MDGLVAFLNAGGDWHQIDTQFHQAEYFRWIDIEQIDFDHDGIGEIVIAGRTPFGADRENQNEIDIYQCASADYELWTSYKLGYSSGASIVGQEQLFPTPYSQVVIEYPQGSAFINFYVVFGWNGSQWSEYFDTATGISSQFVAYDQDGDQIKEIALIGGTSVSGGGGISRKVISYYKWLINQYVLEKDLLLPSRVRIHYLEDAQNALNLGDVPYAIVLYEKAAYDESLDNVASMEEIIKDQMDQAGSYQKAFAAFRLAILWLKFDRQDQAAEVIAEMRQTFPAGKPGSEFVEAVEVLQQHLAAGDGPYAACGYVTRFLLSSYPLIKDHIGYWGAANISYEIGGLCQFR